MGTKGRPFYRVVVAPSTAGRNSSFVETIGTYDPQSKPKHVQINEERALHWLMQGAQPTETTAILLSRTGILDRYFEQRPAAKKNFSFLDKRVQATASTTPAPAPAPAAKASPASEPEPEAAATPELETIEQEPVAAEEPAATEASAESTEGEE